MTKKQSKEIARRWAAASLLAFGGDSFEDEGLREDDITSILTEVWAIANKLKGNFK